MNLFISIAIDSAERFDMAYACITNLLVNAPQPITVQLNINQEDLRFPREHVVQALAHMTGNRFYAVNFPQHYSLGVLNTQGLLVAERYRHVNSWAQYDYWMNVDADLLVPAKTLDLIYTAIENEGNINAGEAYLFSFIDVWNIRNFPDWSDAAIPVSVFGDYHELPPLHNKTKLANEDDNYLFISAQKLWTPSFILPMRGPNSVLNHVGQFNEQDWPKGIRGYDRAMLKNYPRRFWIAGTDVFHMVVDDKIYDNKLWLRHHDQFEGQVDSEGRKIAENLK